MTHSPNHRPATPDADSTPDERERDVADFLGRWPPPEARPEAKARLFAALAAAELTTRAPLRAPRIDLRWAWLLVRAQVRLVHPLTWIASALVLALGAAVTIALLRPGMTGGELPFVVVAPIVTAIGVAFLYGEDSDPSLELAWATPAPPPLLLLARLLALFGFNLLLSLGCSAILAAARADVSLLPLVLAWLAPMTFLSALAFLLSVLSFDPSVSIILSLGVWAAGVARRFAEIGTFEASPIIATLPDLLAPSTQPVLFALALAALVLAVVFINREERWTRS